MASGTVKWFKAQKGYGFIRPDEKGPTFSCILAQLKEPACVSLERAKRSCSTSFRIGGLASLLRTTSALADQLQAHR
jgi:'Cold-shock' DNA-binding domain